MMFKACVIHFHRIVIFLSVIQHFFPQNEGGAALRYESGSNSPATFRTYDVRIRIVIPDTYLTNLAMCEILL